MTRKRFSDDGHEFLSREQRANVATCRRELTEMSDDQRAAFCDILFGKDDSTDELSLSRLAILVCQYSEADRKLAWEFSLEEAKVAHA